MEEVPVKRVPAFLQLIVMKVETGQDDNALLLQKYKMISLLNSDDLYPGIIL